MKLSTFTHPHIFIYFFNLYKNHGILCNVPIKRVNTDKILPQFDQKKKFVLQGSLLLIQYINGVSCQLLILDVRETSFTKNLNSI